MKKFILYSFFLLPRGSLHAQDEIANEHQFFQNKIVVKVDSLKHLLSSTESDTAKVSILGHLCFSYAFIYPDSGLQYGQQGLALSRKIDFKRGLAYCNQSISFCLWPLGNYTDALEFALNSLQQYEELHDPLRIAYSYLALANVYREVGDYEKALLEAHRGLAIYESMHFSPKVSFGIIASIYESQNQHLDSALVYFQKAYQLDVEHNGGNWGWLSYGLGNVQAKLKNFDLALSYYRLALPLATKDDYPKDVVDIFNSMAAVYKETGKKDSCIYYANEVLEHWNFTSYHRGMMQAANTLASMYRLINQKDSTIKYLELSITLNKYLFNEEKERNFQNLVFNEQTRRQDKEHAESQAKLERRKNLQLLAIAAFILTFFIGVIAISRNKSFIVIARFLGLIGLLLVFEFVNLLTHPFIENITLHNPIWTLLILVLLASMLIPAHHYLENMIRRKLVKRRKGRKPKMQKME